MTEKEPREIESKRSDLRSRLINSVKNLIQMPDDEEYAGVVVLKTDEAALSTGTGFPRTEEAKRAVEANFDKVDWSRGI